MAITKTSYRKWDQAYEIVSGDAITAATSAAGIGEYVACGAIRITELPTFGSEEARVKLGRFRSFH